MAQMRIATTIETFYDDSAPMGTFGNEYKRVIEKLDEEARTNLVCMGKNKMFIFRRIIIMCLG